MKPTYVIAVDNFLGAHPEFVPYRAALIALVKRKNPPDDEILRLCRLGERAVKVAIARPEASYESVFEREPGGTPGIKLLWAANRGISSRAASLLRAGSIEAEEMNHALQEAASNGHTEVSRLLLAAGADIHDRDECALKLAAGGGHRDTVEWLISSGADLHAGQDDALTWAAKNGHVIIVQLFVAIGARASGDTHYALSSAALRGHAEVVQFLVTHGADAHSDDENPLRQAAMFGRTECVRVLLMAGGNVHAVRDYSLRFAAAYGHTSIVEMLLEHGAEIHVFDDLPLRLAARNGHTDIVQLLLLRGADLNAHNRGAHRWAAEQGHTDTLEAINAFEHGIPFREPNADQTPVEPAESVVWHWLRTEGLNDTYAHTYEAKLLGLFQTPARIIRWLRGAWRRGEIYPSDDPLYRFTQFDLPPPGDWDRAAWGDFCIRFGAAAMPFIRLAPKLGHPTTPREMEARAALLAYQRAGEHPDLAKLFYSLRLEEATFELALSLQAAAAKTSCLPDVTVECRDMRLSRLPPGDIRGLVLGHLTGCCQSIGSIGEDCAIYGYCARQSGFFVVEQGGQIVGQTWATIVRGRLLLDSLETLGRRLCATDWEDLLRQLHDVTGISIHIGAGGGTPPLNLPTAEKPLRQPFYLGYTDAAEQYCLDSSIAPARTQPSLDLD
jgi:ankyrin repeat protein